MKVDPNPSQKYENTYALLDMGFFLHKNLEGAFQWYKQNLGLSSIQENKLNEHDFARDDDYMHMVKRYLLDDLRKIRQNYFVRPYNIVMCADCRKQDIWRRDILSSYKVSRMEKPKEDEPDFGSVFNYTFEKIVPKLKQKYNVKYVRNPSCEGDDVIAILTRYLVSKNYNVIIFANDSDLRQLITTENVKIIDAHDRVRDISNIDYKYERFMKAVLGDKKDDVPHIHKRCGPKTAEKYYNNRELLKEKLKQNPDIREQLEMNKNLQWFDRIPEELQNEVINTFLEECGYVEQ